jgi:hypothetical protein
METGAKSVRKNSITPAPMPQEIVDFFCGGLAAGRGALGLARKAQPGKRNLPMRPVAPIYGALRIRTEFAQLARSLVERGVLPGPSSDGLRVARIGRGGCRPAGLLASFETPASVCAGDCTRKAGVNLLDKGRQSGSDRNRDIGGAKRRQDGAPSDVSISG